MTAQVAVQKTVEAGGVKTSYRLDHIDGIEFVRAEPTLFMNEDGSMKSESEIFDSLVGKVFRFPDGDVEIVRSLPGKNMRDELFRRFPSQSNLRGVKKPSRLNAAVNRNIEELIENSDAVSLNDPDVGGRHAKQGIVSFDTRSVNFYDGYRAYAVEFSIGVLNDGRKVAYAKRDYTYNKALTEKIRANDAKKQTVEKAVRATGKEAVAPDVQLSQLSSSEPNQLFANENKIAQAEQTVNTPYALDSVGRELSEGQREYFKDSVVRDEQGRLKLMYHGTSYGGYTIFDTFGGNHGLFGMGSYFTDSKNVAEGYTKKGKGTNPQIYPCYLNITNPIDMDAIGNRAQWQEAFPDAILPETGTNEEFYRAVEDYFADEMYPKWEAAEAIRSGLEDMGYDGITHIGGGRTRKDSERHRVYISFFEEQIKSVDNLNPTTDADIRYSVDHDLLRELDGYNTHKVITQKAVLPNFDSDFILGNEAKGITGILDQALNDPAVQDVVTAENMVYEKFSNWNRDINNADAEAIEEAKRVRDMTTQVAVQKTVEAGGMKTKFSADTALLSAYREPITMQDVEVLRSIGVKKSINSFTDDEIRKTGKWAYKFYQDFGTKSPFFRKWFGDWRAYDLTPVKAVAASSEPNKTNGREINKETKMTISFGKKLRDETRNHQVRSKMAVPAINDIKQVIHDAVYFDTLTSDPSKKGKLPGTTFMHSFYSLYESQGKTYLLKLYVEEAFSQKDGSVFDRAYQLKDIEEVTPLPESVLPKKDEGLTYDRSANKYNVSDLYSFVKQYDKDFTAGKGVSPLLLNKDGTPKKVFHGTLDARLMNEESHYVPGTVFTVFDNSKSFYLDSEHRTEAFFFASNKKVAEAYAPALEENDVNKWREPHVYDAFLKIENPLIVEGKGAKWNEVPVPDFIPRKRYFNYRTNSYEFSDTAKTDYIAKQAKKLGYDGVIFKDIVDYNAEDPSMLGDVYAVFDSTQIKSATDNIGLFDRQNPDIRYSIDHDLLRELDGYNTHGDAMGRQGKAVEKMFVQAFKEAKQDSNASLEVYADTLVAFDNLLPKLRKFVDGTLAEKSTEKLTDELVGIVDKALDNAKGEKKAHPLIESYVGGAIGLTPEQAKELKSLGYSVIQYQAMLTKALGYRAHVTAIKNISDIKYSDSLEQAYQEAYDETGDESYNVTAVGLRFGKYEFVPLLGKIYVISCPVG